MTLPAAGRRADEPRGDAAARFHSRLVGQCLQHPLPICVDFRLPSASGHLLRVVIDRGELLFHGHALRCPDRYAGQLSTSSDRGCGESADSRLIEPISRST